MDEVDIEDDFLEDDGVAFEDDGFGKQDVEDLDDEEGCDNEVSDEEGYDETVLEDDVEYVVERNDESFDD
ncbi:hypothetical protein JHK84_027551 [Glycine max]|nr:hypothetical protein JHK85_027948 [Glycine max]KAG5151079.1 hypothetical protein JHK84_027551 [Glycine max]